MALQIKSISVDEIACLILILIVKRAKYWIVAILKLKRVTLIQNCALHKPTMFF
jgi:hypothetical protein